MDESSCRPRQVDGDGAAKRRRLHRLRSWWRHEQQTVAAVLATYQHHSASWGPRTARTGGGARDELHGHAPGRCSPQGRILRHVVGHLPAPSLDVPVPLMVDQLPDIEHFFAALSPDPGQVIEVPKILPLDVPMRAVLRVTQLVEQLVEVPTTVTYSSLQRTVEQHVDIPVPGGGGGSVSGLHGFLPRQRSTASPSRKRISERIVEQIVDPVSGGGLHGSLPGQSSSSSHSPAGVEERADEPGEGFFRTFPKLKKVRRSLRTRGRNCLRTPAHGRRRLSWRTPSSGCGSRMTSLASRTTGTDALVRLSGSHRLASRWCGTPKGMRRGPATSGTRKRVSPRLTSPLFLLGEKLHRQPRAVYKYWVPYCAFFSVPRLWQSFIRCSLWFDSGYILRQSTAACGRYSSWTKVCSLFVVQRQVPGCPDIPVVRRGSSPWSSSSFSWCSFRTRLLLCPLLVNDRCPCSAVAVLHGR